jgi:GT2 family glycosyltransferase
MTVATSTTATTPLGLPHVAVVILNYNSEADLKVCAEHVTAQEGVRLSIVIVDNASAPGCIAGIKQWLLRWRPDAISGTEQEVMQRIRDGVSFSVNAPAVYFIANSQNRGYSAGNNSGIRIAEALEADAVLIANPDIRIEDPHYVRDLAAQLLADPRNFVAASRVVDLAGADQNPQREPSFAEELTWGRYLLPLLPRANYVIPASSDSTIEVPKVSGCCLMLRSDFLRRIGNLDEHVFLYCEEPILAAQVHKLNGRILYVPTLRAVHAHVKSEKGSVARRMLQFIESRRYYLATYSGYGSFRLKLLSLSYAALALVYRLRKARGK